MYKIIVYWKKSKRTYVLKARTMKDVNCILDDYRRVRDIKIKVKEVNR